MVRFESHAATALVIGFALAFAACGGKDDEQATKAADRPPISELYPDAEFGEDGEIRYSGETDSGETYTAQIGGDVSLPSDLDSDLPGYPGAVPQSAIETSDGTAIAALESDAKAEDIIEFYRDRLTSGGWTIGSDSDLGNMKLLTAKKDGRRVTINAKDMDEGSMFTMSVWAAPAN